jgi:predicted nucleic acid-binding protein
MRVLVSDTSVLIDLERGDLIELAFGLTFELAVPDVLYRRELRDFEGQRFVDLGLRVEELEADGVADAQAFRRRVPRLSVPDSLALALAQRRTWTLLTGDGALRQLALAEGVACHGVLWLLDRMLEGGVSGDRLREGLATIVAHPQCRLPVRDVRLCLERYGG